jgi:hypothetical protein
MKGCFAMSVVLVAALCGGCATQTRTVPTAVVAPVAAKVVAANRVKHAVAPGKSTKADVLAALGESLVIRFDSGYEVWVYRLDDGLPDKAGRTASWWRTKPEAAATGEFVILFAPSGVVAKTRIRTAPPPRSAG